MIDVIPARKSDKVQVTCDFKVSDKCRGTYTHPYKVVLRFRKSNSGKDICLYCSRHFKFSGNNNPNAKYSIDSSIFDNIDTEEKAYLLGWIASDGHISKSGFVISIHNRDKEILVKLRDTFFPGITIKASKGKVSLSIFSKKISTTLCNILKIKGPGKKSHTVGFPDLEPGLVIHFLRGFFDGDGHVRKVSYNRDVFPKPECGISTSSKRFREVVIGLYGGTESGINITWSGTNALDLLSKMYDGAKIFLRRKKEAYEDWCSWVPGLRQPGYTDGFFRATKARKDAVLPFKVRASDSGYDITILEATKKYGNTTLYDTGIKIQPPNGWYFDLIARSSIIKTGYMLANGIGVIDASYLGTIMVPLIKVDPNAPDLVLPARIAQLVPRPIIHATFEEVEDLESTNRGTGGFGSTGVK